MSTEYYLDSYEWHKMRTNSNKVKNATEDVKRFLTLDLDSQLKQVEFAVSEPESNITDLNKICKKIDKIIEALKKQN